MKYLLIVLVAALARLSSSAPTLEDQWTEFKTTHKRQYSDTKEELKRFQIFSDNLAKIEAHNAKYRDGKVTYYQGMNKFGDWTTDEFLSFVNAGYSKTVIPQENLKTHVTSPQPLAADVDWRTQGVLTNVSDELGCGASWAFSALGALESQIAINGGQLRALSAQNLIDCSGDASACEGGLSQSVAYDYIQANGINSEADYPYQGDAGSCRFDSSTSVIKIPSYVKVIANEYELEKAVTSVGPVAVSVHATGFWQFYYGGVFFDDTCFFSEDDLNHGGLVVGFGSELLYQYWIVKNSWGVGWGENGYMKSIRNYGNNCGIATRPLYPEV